MRIEFSPGVNPEFKAKMERAMRVQEMHQMAAAGMPPPPPALQKALREARARTLAQQRGELQDQPRRDAAGGMPPAPV